MKKISFIVLVIGSVIFCFTLYNAMASHGSTNLDLRIQGLREGLYTIGHYLIFVSIIFGANFLLVEKK